MGWIPFKGLVSFIKTCASIDLKLQVLCNEMRDLKEDIRHLNERVDHIYELVIMIYKNGRKN